MQFERPGEPAHFRPHPIGLNYFIAALSPSPRCITENPLRQDLGSLGCNSLTSSDKGVLKSMSVGNTTNLTPF